MLLARPDLPNTFLDEIAKHRDWLRSYAVKRAIVFHLNAPRPAVSRLLRDIYLMDLVKLTNAPATPADIRRAAEEQLIGQLPQLPLGQKIALGRQASAHVLGALLIEGNRKVLPPVLQNPRLTEAQVLKRWRARNSAQPLYMQLHAICAGFPGRWYAGAAPPSAASAGSGFAIPGAPFSTRFACARFSAELEELAGKHVAHEIARNTRAARD